MAILDDTNNVPTNNVPGETGISRRGFLKWLALLIAAVFDIKTIVAACTQPKNKLETSGRFESARIEFMEDGNMHSGFGRYKIIAKDRNGVEKLVGSFFGMMDDKAAARFFSNKHHPDFFDEKGRPFFDKIKNDIEKTDAKTVLIVAWAYLKPDTLSIEGRALENGIMVGEIDSKSELNGLLVIKDGVPEIQYLTQIWDQDAFLKQAEKEKWSLFQQTSFIRPGGRFVSQKDGLYELRFFVEGGGKKGVVNFSEKMTYNEAVFVMNNIAGWSIEKAIGLDTGIVSEGYFYDTWGKSFVMVDESFGPTKGGATNFMVLFSR